MTYLLSQSLARALDVELMNPSGGGFSLDQLMELAGLAVAQIVAFAYPATSTRILTIAGPGNNGGDGLVAARHLKLFGYDNVRVLYPKPNPQFDKLVTQLQQVDVPVTSSSSAALEMTPANFDLVLDGVFGFSFQMGGDKGVRAPFDAVMRELRTTKVPIASIDVPSGWDVELGDVNACGVVMPDLLISLTAPKPCARNFTGRHHFLGGRFLPPKLAAKYGLDALPKYESFSQFVRLPVPIVPEECSSL